MQCILQLFGSIPTKFLFRGPSPSGPSRLNFYSRVRPDFKFPCTMQPAGQNAPHLANPPGKTPRTPQGSIPFGSVTALNFCSWVRPFESVPTLNLCSVVRPLRVRPDFKFMFMGPSPRVRLDFKLLFKGPSPRVRPNFYISASDITSPHIQNRREKIAIGSSISIIAIKLGLISSFRVKIVLSGEQCTRNRTLRRARVPARPAVRTATRPRTPSSPNVHALAPEHLSKGSTESPDSRTLPRLFPRIPRQGLDRRLEDHPDPEMASKLLAMSLNGMAET
ncbi:hypothetical protein CRG98_001106 [Punica granatum]|uniref:Uncharacterized protein n=1 Tax=Punica granatum TaxID=22663 RepID=A0A2I0LE17_PUNGR|nr:hypothetical protein CRG98_001106 [Punica granatum]